MNSPKHVIKNTAKLNPELFGGAKEFSLPPFQGLTAQFGIAVVNMQQSRDERLNQTERAWLNHLQTTAVEKYRLWIGKQAITLEIGDDCRYTPGFVCVEFGMVVAYEVKGVMRDDARAKLKVAACQFPGMRFIAVKKVKGGSTAITAPCALLFMVGYEATAPDDDDKKLKRGRVRRPRAMLGLKPSAMP